MRIRILPILIAAALVLTACSVAPRKKTVVLELPPTETAEPVHTGGAPSFDIDKISVLPLDKLDPGNVFGSSGKLLFGWLDNDHLAGLALEYDSERGGERNPPAAINDKDIYGRVSVPLEEKVLMTGAGTLGYKSSVVSLDWQYGFAEKLFQSEEDTVILSAALSPDRTRAWYSTMSYNKESKYDRRLVVTDKAFKTKVMDLSEFQTEPVWATSGNYLCLFSYISLKDDRTIYDVSGEKAEPYDLQIRNDYLYKLLSGKSGWLYGFNPVQQELLMAQEDGSLFTVKTDVMEMPDMGVKSMRKYVYDAKLLRSGYSMGLTDTQLFILSPENAGISTSYDRVMSYAVSDDEKYICYAQMTGGDTADVYAGKLQNGTIQDAKLVLKGFYPMRDAMFFSPDNDKLLVYGRYNPSDTNIAALVLKFK